MKKLIYIIHDYLFPNDKTELLKSQLKEINRQHKRVSQAYDLHRYVLRNYGYQAYGMLEDPEGIIKDTKEITVFNYLDTEQIFIK